MGHPWASPYGLSSLRHVQMAHVLLRRAPIWGMGPGPLAPGLSLGSGGRPFRAYPGYPIGPHGSPDGPSHTTRARVMCARARARAPAE